MREFQITARDKSTGRLIAEYRGSNPDSSLTLFIPSHELISALNVGGIDITVQLVEPLLPVITLSESDIQEIK